MTVFTLFYDKMTHFTRFSHFLAKGWENGSLGLGSGSILHPEMT